MSAMEVTDILMDRIETILDLPPIQWPNQKLAEGTFPRVEVTMFRNQPVRLGVTSRLQHRHPGFLQASVVIAKNRAPSSAFEIAQPIADVFPVDWQAGLTGGGYVRVTQRPQIDGGIQGDYDWRLPVTVYYDAFY